MKTDSNSLQAAVHRITQIHFAYIVLYMVSLIAFDSWNLITHEGIVWRWQAASSLLIVNAVGWYLARTNLKGKTPYKLIVLALIIGDIVFACLNVTWERGMASKSVALFAVPIVIAAILHSRRAILATTTFSAAAYSLVTVKYFHLNYGEGLKVQLYGTILFYCGLFYILALMLMLVIKSPAAKNSK